MWATYYGGSNIEFGHSICTDISNILYVTGFTSSTNFPTQVLPGAYNQTISGGYHEAFILKFSSSCVRLWATYYGGNSTDIGQSICIDNLSNLFVIGETYSSNFPIQTLSGAYNQTTYGGNRDAFVIKFNSTGVRLWATYYGGSNSDFGIGICSDNNGNLYIAGGTQSTNFPIQTLAGAYNQTYHAGNGDAFILRFGTPPSSPVLISPANNSTGLQLSLNLVWTNAQYVESYRVQLSTDSLFNNLIINDSTLTDTIKTVSGLTPLTYYWWRVSAKNIAGTSPYSSAWKFRTLGYPTQVNLIYPPDDTTNIPVNVNFIWNKAIDQTDVIKTFNRRPIDNRTISKYWFELTTDTSGTPFIIDSTLTDTTKSVSSLNNLTAYYWHVKAKNEIGWGVYSLWFKFTTIGASNISGNSELPKEFRLYNSYPNPFNPSTKIKFDILKSSNVKIIIYNALGKEVTSLVNEKLIAGSYEVSWNGSSYPSGVYFYKLVAGDFVNVKKMVLLK